MNHGPFMSVYMKLGPFMSVYMSENGVVRIASQKGKNVSEPIN